MLRRTVATSLPTTTTATVATTTTATTVAVSGSTAVSGIQSSQQRRLPGALPRPVSSSSTSSSSITTRYYSNHKRSRVVDVSIAVLLFGALLLLLATFLFPDVRHAEEEKLKQLMMMRGEQKPPLLSKDEEGNNDYNNGKIYELSTKWVDGEKKLKQQLERLVQRQASGMDVGVPVLTRWLGDDIPAWPTDPNNPMSTTDWEKKVEEKYALMRQEEVEWRMKMTHYLNQEQG